MGKNTLAAHLSMEVVEVTAEHVCMRMPVTSQVHQPMGLLHGGAIAALAENVSSLAGYLVAHSMGKICVGLSLNTNHIKSVRDGFVYATATAVHLGKSTQVWEVRTKTEDDTLINICTATLKLLDQKK